MRVFPLTVSAIVLFAGGFGFVRAREGGLREELAALERAADELRRAGDSAEFHVPGEPPPIHRISVATLTSPRPFRYGPGDIDGVVSHADETPLMTGVMDDWPQPFGTIEEVAELLRENEERQGFEIPGLTANGMELIYRGPAEGAARIERFLEQELRPRVLQAARIEVAWEMGAGRGNESFNARMLSLVGAGGMFWVGRQHALLADADVSPTFGPLGIVDPLITRIYTGEWIFPELAFAGEEPRGKLRFESRRLEGRIRSLATRRSGTLELPRARETRTEPSLHLRSDEWERVYAGVGVLRVRGRVFERGSVR